jgi:hypothetical protein
LNKSSNIFPTFGSGLMFNSFITSLPDILN